MKTVFVVTAGEYSDYGICGIFSSQESAEKYMNAFPKGSGYGGYNDVEEWELDQHIDAISRGLTHYKVRMYRDGSVHDVELSTYGMGNDDGRVFWMDRAYWNPPQPWANFYVWADTREAAIKIANERRVQSIAAETHGS